MVLETGLPHNKKKNLDTILTPLTKVNTKWIIDLNVKCITIKLLEDNKGKTYWYGHNFFRYNTKATIHEINN